MYKQTEKEEKTTKKYYKQTMKSKKICENIRKNRMYCVLCVSYI